MGATVFEIAWGGGARLHRPLVKGVGTKGLGKGGVKADLYNTPDSHLQYQLGIPTVPAETCSVHK